MQRFLRAWIRYPRVVLALVASSVLACAWLARTIELRFQYRDFYDYDENPGVEVLRKYNRIFGDYARVVVLIEAPDVFSLETLRYVDDVTRELQKLPAFSKVLSLTNASTVRAVGDEIETGPIISRLPTSETEVSRIRALALQSIVLKHRIIAADGSATAILAELRQPSTFATVAEQQAALDAAQRVLDQHQAPAR
ncbi:MAG TPA: hypothetical protein VJR89_08170, partial [Polyangiales bacterium]|nr:hypothetical protein [Polyangiales bacterium]